MRLRSLFTVMLPVERAWEALLEVAKGERPGVLKVKVGGVAAEYHGTVAIKEADEAGRRLVAYVSGIEARDQSAASATITATLTATSEGTAVALDTDLSVGGRLSPFGAGVIGDVAGALVKRFAATLEATAATAATANQPGPAPVAPAGDGQVTVVAQSSGGAWLPAAVVGVFGLMAVTDRRGVRWALAAVGAGLVVAGQRSRSST